jgi:hypothetical protein
MKATKAGRVIGIALENYSGSEIGKIMVFVNPHWIGNDLSVEQDDSGQIVNLDVEQLRSGLASLGLIVNENGVLEVDTLKTRQLCVGSVCVTEAEFQAVFGDGVGDSSGSGGNSGSSGSGGSVPDVCDATHLNLCSTQADCEASTGYWYNDICNAEPESVELEPEPEPEPTPEPTPEPEPEPEPEPQPEPEPEPTPEL